MGILSPKKNQKLSVEAMLFRRFAISAITFVGAMCAIVYANLVLPPSTQQELLALAALVLAAPSGLSAFYYYLRLLWNRLQRFNKE